MGALVPGSADATGNCVINFYLGADGNVGFKGLSLTDEFGGLPVRSVVAGPFIVY